MSTALHPATRTEIAKTERHSRLPRTHADVSAGSCGAAPYRAHAIPLPADLWRGHTLLRVIYRGLECLAALVMLLLTAPILLLEAILIRLDSPGPALFWQVRMGQSVVRRGRDIMHRKDLVPPEGGFQPDRLYLVPQTINFVKFRTMYVDARERCPELYDVGFPSREAFLAGYYKREHDPRVTRVGRFFRRTTLDELPNLLLVLTGSMRLIGPRPEGPWFVPYYSPEEMLKFAVKPGVTGLAQSSGRGQLPIGAQIAYDLEYMRKRSVWLDLRILVNTFLTVLKRRGAF